MKNTTIEIIYDNDTSISSATASHGFACIIRKRDNTLLFDTGARPDILMSNMKELGVSANEITGIFISHNHWDHTGGLFSILELNSNVKVFVPSSFSTTYQKEISSYGAEIKEIREFSSIENDIFSTGSMGEKIIEQSMIIRTGKGPVIITGCAHPGIIKIIKSTISQLKENIHMVIGGFHLADKSRADFEKIIKEFRTNMVEKVRPCHCTDKGAIEMFKKEYMSDFIETKVGKKIDVD